MTPTPPCPGITALIADRNALATRLAALEATHLATRAHLDKALRQRDKARRKARKARRKH